MTVLSALKRQETIRLTYTMLLSGLLAACHSGVYNTESGGTTGSYNNPGSDRYSHHQDSAPNHQPDVSGVAEPTPQYEPPSRYGNPASYQVNGQTYYVLKTATGYDQRGGASWYGKKFHGHRTSSGETYDMYKMTAAHKTLPLPTHVRVTNLDNDKSVIVRVNDRGPFHPDRIIDLSWAAAAKLGIDKQGVGRVRVQALETSPGTSSEQPVTSQAAATSSPPPVQADEFFIQIGAYRDPASAQDFMVQALSQHAYPLTIRPFQHAEGRLYKVWAGPFATMAQRDQALLILQQQGYPDAVRINPGTP